MFQEFLDSGSCLLSEEKSLPILVFQLNSLDDVHDLFQKSARHGLPLSPPPRDASSRPQHTVPTPWLPLPPPGPRFYPDG